MFVGRVGQWCEERLEAYLFGGIVVLEFRF